MDKNETVLSCFWVPGKDGKDILRQKVIVNGMITYRDIEDVVSDQPTMTDRFKNTDFAPTAAKPETTGPIQKKIHVEMENKPSKEFIQKHLDRSAMMEAMLIRIIGSPSKVRMEGGIWFNGKTELHEYVVLMCRAMGEEYEEIIPLLHANKKAQPEPK
jgi:hypothetical protein